MSTEAGPAPPRRGLIARAHGILEVPFLFDLYQVVGDGGKRKPVSRFLDGVDYESVVDLGCGTGAWSFLARGPYLGLDYSTSFIDGCRRRFGDDPDKRFEVGDLASTGLDEVFDLALMMSVLHHLSDADASSVLERLADHAGRVLVMDLLPIEKNPVSRLLYRLDRGDYIRSAEQQEALLTANGHWEVERSDAFFSYNRLYRHSLYLLRSTDPPAH